ncbi:MAG: PP2C family protein-serine/threonine phosphatase [Thermomicrobiales bacterium]
MIAVLAAGLAGCGDDRTADTFVIVCPNDPALRERKGALFAVADSLERRAGAAALAGLVEAYYAPASPARIEPALGWAVQMANLRVLDLAVHDSATREIQTALSCLVVTEDRAYFAHVGDGRIYLARDGALRQLTTGHVEAAEQRWPRPARPEGADHPRRTLLTRTLGTTVRLRPDFARQSINSGDIFLICSRGVWSALTDGELLLAVSTLASPAATCQRMFGLLGRQQQPDRATAVVLRVEGGQANLTPECPANAWRRSPLATTASR